MRSTHVTIKDESLEKLNKRIDNMEQRGYKLDGEITPRDGYYGITYYAKLEWCGKL